MKIQMTQQHYIQLSKVVDNINELDIIEFVYLLHNMVEYYSTNVVDNWKPNDIINELRLMNQ